MVHRSGSQQLHCWSLIVTKNAPIGNRTRAEALARPHCTIQPPVRNKNSSCSVVRTMSKYPSSLFKGYDEN